MKIVKRGLVVIGTVILGVFIYVIYHLILNPANDYSEISIPKSHFKEIINKELLPILVFDGLSYKNEDGSTLSFMTLKNNPKIKIVIWKFVPYQNINFSEMEIFQTEIKKEDLKTYSSISTNVFPFLDFTSKTKTSTISKLNFNVGNSVIQKETTENDYKLMHILLDEVSLGSNHFVNDIIIQSGSKPLESKMLLMNKENYLTIALFYSTDKDFSISESLIDEFLK